MSAKIMSMAKRYYPHLWPIERLDILLTAGKITEEEYNEILKNYKTQLEQKQSS